MQRLRPPSIRISRWILGLLLVQALGMLIYIAVDRRRAKTREADSFPYERMPGVMAPNLFLARPDGETRDLAELRGKTILLHFWATWCPPCREELPALLEVGQEIARDAPFLVVAVTLDEDWSEVGKFFGGTIPDEVYRDRDGEASKQYEISTLPDSYLLGSDGSLRLRFLGARDWRCAAARDLLSKSAGAGR